ncbi:hypothetical protein DFH08DRAFT_811591 [Mycena albidolilacea]|uniref:Uncharacterized protein n=1 Tax=Mycena albidolilacea TaxID=1033008 RepID=A0AAD6ZVP5_9AGAR|nr:hypothetical protein DFH08DRAFT_811591 [Mycena albidolilacea]
MGLFPRQLLTDDKHFKQILLQTYRDYATLEELFEVLIQRFLEVHRKWRQKNDTAEPDNPYQIAVALTLMEAELRQTNYNSAAVIDSVLVGWRKRSITDIPRTIANLENNTQASFEQLANPIEPDYTYQAYKKTVGMEYGLY